MHMKNAIEIIKDDHRAVENAYARYQAAPDTPEGEQEKDACAKEIFDSLEAHTAMEEDHFYPVLREAGGMKETAKVAEAYTEHAGVKVLIKTLRNASAGAIRDTGMKEMMAMVAHHVKEEETELLPDAEKILGEATLEDLGKTLAPLAPSQS
jgi:hypothetical protein